MAEAGQEILGRELFRMRVQVSGIEIPFALFEALQDLGQALRGLSLIHILTLPTSNYV